MNTSCLPGTDERVRQHTAPHVNRELRESTIEALRAYVGADGSAIDDRLKTRVPRGGTIAILGNAGGNQTFSP